MAAPVPEPGSSHKSGWPVIDDDSQLFSALRIAGTYLGAGLLWILLSDVGLAWLGGVTPIGFWIAVGKGMLFVALSTLLVYWLSQHEYRRTRRATELLRAVVEGTNDAVFVKDVAGRYLLANSAAARFIGRPVAQVLGRTDRELFNAAEAERVIENDRTIMANQRLVTLEETLTSEGQTRIYQATKGPYCDASGRLLGLIGISRDVSYRVQVETALRETQARLQAAVEVAGLGVIAVDYATDTLDISTRAASQFGLANTGRLSRNELHARIHPEDRETLDQLIAAALDPSGTGGFAAEHRVVHPDGNIRWLTVRKQVSFTDGRPQSAVVVTADITDQRQVQAELQQSEQRYRLLFDANPHPMWVYDVETLHFSAVNDAAIQAYGYTREQFLSMSVRDIRPPEDLEAFESFIARSTSSKVNTTQWRHVRSNGTVFDVEVSSHDLPANHRRSRLVLALDITDRKRAEAELKQSERRLRLALEAAGAVAFVWNIVTDEVTRYYSTEPALPVTLKPGPVDDVRNCVHPDDLSSFDANLAACLEQGSEYRNQYRVVRPDGTIAWLEDYGVLDRAPDGSPLFLTGLVLNVTSRVTATERSTALLRSVFDSVGDAILTINARGIITSCNQATTRLFGYADTELLDSNVSVLMPEPYRQQHDRYVSDYVRTHIPKVIGIGREVEGRRKDGTTFPAELTITEFKRDGDIEFTGVLRDITARRQLEEQFRQAQKMEAVGRLAGGVAHDFNNLLTVINGYSELMLTGLPSDDPARASLAAIHDAGDRAARLTEQLLAFSRKSLTEPRLVNLSELAIESSKLLRRLIGEDIALSVLTDPLPAWVIMDPVQLEQVLMNLAVNARDAMPRGGQLTIETHNVQVTHERDAAHPGLSPGNYATLLVTDTGGGMTAEVRERVFEPFFTTKGLGKGTGLGLAVVHGIVQQAGGIVTVDSTLGHGTTFHIYLPAATEAARSDTLLETSVAPQGHETILVVEDDESVRTLVRVALESQGYTVLVASSGYEAEQLLSSRCSIDLLITDVIMPAMSGHQLALSLRNQVPDLRVLYMSGYTDDALDRHGLQEATDHFIAKPFTPLGLARRVRDILDAS